MAVRSRYVDFVLMRRNLFLILLSSLVSLASWGQDERFCFNHLEFGAGVGTTGIGFDFSTPLTEDINLRTGISFVPHLKFTGSHDVFLNGEPVVPTFGEDGERTDRMGKLLELMQSFTGYQMDQEIGMYMKPTMWNFNILVDWYPFEVNYWHFTAGLYMGPSEIARICNNPEEMHTLTGMGIYNGMYNKIMAGEPILSIGGQTVEFPDRLTDRVRDYGIMSIPVGEKSDGSSFSFEPGPDGMVKTLVKTNWIRPYLGCGYTCWFDLEHRTSFSIDFGMLIWGGKPSIKAADGTDFARDMRNMTGDVGRWVDFYSTWTVMPVLEIRFRRRLF